MSTIAPNPMPELAPLLKRLRLSGILDSLETRNREAVANKIPYTDFLALLIADEVARREHKKFNLRIRRAGFRSSKTIEQFDFDFNPAIDQTLIADLATCRFVAEKVAVLIAGPCGTGKSHIAQALGHAAVRADYDVLFTTQSQLLASLNAARAINAYERRFHTFARVPLLVIDDFGLKPLVRRYKRLPWVPSDEQWHCFLGHARDEPLRNRCMLALAYDAALRREELCVLESGDIQPAHRLLRVRAETSKSGQDRIVSPSTWRTDRRPQVRLRPS